MRSQPVPDAKGAGRSTNHRLESMSMDRQVVAFPAYPCKTPPKKSLLALMGAAMLLLGCQTDPGGTAPGGLEPSASSQQSGDRGLDASSDDDSGDSGSGSGSDGGSGGGSGSGSGGGG
jgi:hypothetical protein